MAVKTEREAGNFPASSLFSSGYEEGEKVSWEGAAAPLNQLSLLSLGLVSKKEGGENFSLVAALTQPSLLLPLRLVPRKVVWRDPVGVIPSFVGLMLFVGPLYDPAFSSDGDESLSTAAAAALSCD